MLAYDAAGRLTGVTDSANAALAVGYGYDALDRLTQAVLPYTTYGYSYDANGNRKTRSFSGTPQAITIAATSNRTLSLAGPPLVTYAYDASGNRTGDDIASYGYDARGRLAQATTPAGTTTYLYNALNQRIRKTGPLGDTLFLHDLAGHLIAEANASGAIAREYVWLDDTPVAILDGPVASTQVFAVHPDQLDTPRAVTDTTGKVVWRNSPVGEPFGLTPPEEDPDHDGTAFVMNLRFPGQYFDRETNLAQNWHRYYDAVGGLYAQSDPIGLAGGQWSTYSYVNGQPTGSADPLGLAADNPFGGSSGSGGFTPAPTPFDVFVPGTAANNAFVQSVHQMANAIGQGGKQWVDDPQAIAEYDEYKNNYREPPPPFMDPCEELRWKLKREEELLRARRAWDAKWAPGRHAGMNGEVQSQNAIKNIKEKMKKQGCQCP